MTIEMIGGKRGGERERMREQEASSFSFDGKFQF